MNKLLYLLLPILFIAVSCDPTDGVDDDGPTGDFDRQAMLANWVNNVILPGMTDLNGELSELSRIGEAFVVNPTTENKEALREQVRKANLVFQNIDFLLIGRAEEIRLREMLNTYPTDTDLIRNNAEEGASSGMTVNLDLPSNVNAQGFPALDYLLYEADDELEDFADGANLRTYLLDVIRHMRTRSLDATVFWTQAEIEAFIANDGNSATASIDRTVNDYIFYYEKFLRAGKVGIPAGVFSDDPLADRVEAPYSGRSNAYFAAALAASKDFFVNHGLTDYLDAMNVERDGERLSAQITAQFEAAEAKYREIDLTFGEQVTTDNVKMLELYNELQRNTILLKVDMLQALSINVDYVDADGD